MSTTPTQTALSVTPPAEGGTLQDVEPETLASNRRQRPLNLSGRVVLLATDGSTGAMAGAHIALELASQYHATIHVVSVVDTRSVPLSAPLVSAVAMGDALIPGAVHKEQADDVRAALSRGTHQPIAWPVRMMIGTPASAIAQEARRLRATLIIVGLRSHSRLERAINDETTLNAMRQAPCPVLGVVPGTTSLPVRVLAGSISPRRAFSPHAARAESWARMRS